MPTLLAATSRLQKPIVTALCTVLLLTIVLLAAPSLISYAFLSEKRQEAVLRLLGHVVDGIRIAVGEDQSAEGPRSVLAQTRRQSAEDRKRSVLDRCPGHE